MRNPDRYRQKDCERCGELHRKRGKYCSRSCAGRFPASAERKRKISVKVAEYYQSEDGEAASRRQSDWAAALNRYKHGYTTEKPDGYKMEDYTLEIPKEIPSLRANQTLEDGDIWETV